MILKSATIEPNRLLIQPFPFLNKLKLGMPLLSPALRWAKFMHCNSKSSAKLARKRTIPSIILPPPKLPPLSRRKRVRVHHTRTKIVKPTVKAKVEMAPACAVPVEAPTKEPTPTLAKVTTRANTPEVPTRANTPEVLTRVNIPDVPTRANSPDVPTRPSTPEPELPDHTCVLKITINDFYKAARRAIGTKGATTTPADKAILEKLRRATWRHNLIAGVKSTNKQIQNVDPKENDRIRAERHKRLEEHEKRKELAIQKAKWEVVQKKRQWAKLIKMAKEGQKAKMNPPKAYVERWKWYDEFWAAFNTGRVSGVVPFDMMPWPTQDVESVELEDYELFILSPARPGYEVLNWYDRVVDERKRWNVENVKRKVVPFVGDDIKERVVRCAEELLQYLDVLVDKYTSCDY